MAWTEEAKKSREQERGLAARVAEVRGRAPGQEGPSTSRAGNAAPATPVPPCAGIDVVAFCCVLQRFRAHSLEHE